MRKRNLCKLLYSLFCICIIWGMFGTKAEHVFAAEDNFDYYQQLDPNSEEYREWKENLVRPKSMVMARRAVNSSTMISNEYIELKPSISISRLILCVFITRPRESPLSSHMPVSLLLTFPISQKLTASSPGLTPFPSFREVLSASAAQLLFVLRISASILFSCGRNDK